MDIKEIKGTKISKSCTLLKGHCTNFEDKVSLRGKEIVNSRSQEFLSLLRNLRDEYGLSLRLTWKENSKNILLRFVGCYEKPRP